MSRSTYIHTLRRLYNLYLHIYFAPQRTQCDSIRKTVPSDYFKNCTKNVNSVHQTHCFVLNMAAHIETAVLMS
jgi:hypothetical protein